MDNKITQMGEIWQKLGLQADDPLVQAVTQTADVKGPCPRRRPRARSPPQAPADARAQNST